jgi:hypothetical protein
MNVNELAVYLEDITDSEESAYRQAATMLRQQQAEISLLQEYVCQLESGLDSSINLNKAQAERHGKNEPVAWMVAEMVFTIEESAVEMAKVYEDEVIPLYTHPAKTLTDEEITDVYVECMLPYGEFDEHEFAKAILRKAQEKP